ncbi:MAG: serine/threonine-protein kinase [Paracoccaceae bacterium]
MIGPLPGDIFHQGQILNNTYEVEGVLGRGGTGEVYRARNLISGRIVAIKALNSQFSGNDDYIELMKREEQMRDIRDDAVVRYTECSRSDQGHVFLVMDFIDGPSMADIMAERRMESRELMIVAHRVAEGLVAAHGQGIVHRDLSPDNIILRGDTPEKATIIDFGIAKDTAAGARTIVGNDFAGKYEYASPEQLEGRAEARSDLYALGALLLAAFRGQVPFAGATPGEMIRRKQEPLDVTGVPDPLKSLILWLSAPKLAERAPSAAAVVEKLNQAIKPISQRGGPRGGPAVPPKPKKAGGKGWVWALLLLIAAGIGGAVYVGGLPEEVTKVVEKLKEEELPEAKPYTLTASAVGAGDAAKLAGNAPDAVAAASIAAAYAKATGAKADPAALKLASGAPSARWPDAVAKVFDAIAGAENWEIGLTDTEAVITGFAPDKAARVGLETRLNTWAKDNGLTLTLGLTTGPRLLPYETVTAILKGLSDCGPLAQSGPPGTAYPMSATIDVTGSVVDPGIVPKLKDQLREVIGDRTVRVDVTPLNKDLCGVRKVLPVVPTEALSIWFGQGDTGEANLTGVFHTGENPLVEILAPATMTEGKLWVVIVDNSGQVFNALPKSGFEETSIAKLGTVENGVRRIRVVHSVSDWEKDPNLMAFRASKDNIGKSEVFAIVAREDLFATRRPLGESVASFSEGIAAVLKEDPGIIFGMTSRIMDVRP